ncbi:MAG: hypothetical protein ABW123_23900 [Cystobacter sp.]
MLRVLLVLILVNGLVPALGEAFEAVEHYVTTGHVAHFESGENDLNTGREHGCGPTSHHCRCCTSQSVVPGADFQWTLVDVAESPRTPFVHGKVAEGPRARLLRPPISA